MKDEKHLEKKKMKDGKAKTKRLLLEHKQIGRKT